MSRGIRDRPPTSYHPKLGRRVSPILERLRMRPLARRTLGGVSLLLVAGFGTTRAQTTYPNVKVTGRLQEQFYYFDNKDYTAVTGPQANFFTRRARIEARGNISENVVV